MHTMSVPGIVEVDAGTGILHLNHAALPRAADRMIFGRGLAAGCVPEAVETVAKLAQPGRRGVLLIVGETSSKAPGVSPLIEKLKRLGHEAGAGVETLVVGRHADHATIRAGIEIARRHQVGVVVAVGGGTVIDVGKSVAALAYQEYEEIPSSRPAVHLEAAWEAGSAARLRPREFAEDEPGARPEVEVDIAGYQLGRRRLTPARALPWVAVPTTSGTGSESTDNAVIELGDEKKSIRGIPAPRFVAADPALTDPLPLTPTIVAAVDALAQSLEVLVSAAASAEVQEVALAGFAALASGVEDLCTAAVRGIREAAPCATPSGEPECKRLYTAWPASPDSADAVAPATRDSLCWGSLLMGLAFANGRLGLPHGLVHFCNRFGLSHGNMVGILLAPALAVQARDSETAWRLTRAAKALDDALRRYRAHGRDTSLNGREPAASTPAITSASASATALPTGTVLLTGVPSGVGRAMPKDLSATERIGQRMPREGVLPGSSPDPLFRWLESRIPSLFKAAGLPTTLRAAGLASEDCDWIVARELESRPSFGTSARSATPAELREVLQRAL
ncbi:MAG: iron-containing alcohol dehydrogenase [Bacillota bacterium]|nr:iron-containing alcohol dehydrogenase [Bacillota bacterium]